MTSDQYFAGGFLYHSASRTVLLQFRGSKTPHSPNTWCFLGGWSEAGDAGPRATWCREMREELGVAVDPERAVPLCDYTPASSPFRRHIFY